MTLFLATMLFGLLRNVVAGYMGPAFFLATITESFLQAWPLLLVAIAAALFSRSRRFGRARVEAVAGVLGYAVAFSLLGKPWLDAHTWISERLGVDSSPSLALAMVGAATGAAVAAWRRRRGEVVATAVTIAVCGWLIVGPDVYAQFDHVESGRRLAAVVGVTVAFAMVAAALVLGGTRLGRRGVVTASLGLALAVVAVARFGPGPSAPAATESIVLVVVDTLRAEALASEPGARATLMPRLEAIAGQGVRFTQAIAPSPWTLPSTMTVLSGLDPHRHLAGHTVGLVPMPGDPAASFLGSALRDRGYLVAGFVNNPYLRPYYGIGNRGFQRFRRYRGDARDGTTDALRWLDLHGERPFFLLLHVMDPHWPYEAPRSFDRERRECAACDDLFVLQYGTTDDAVRGEVRRRYEAEVRFTDEQIGRLYDAMSERGLLEKSWFVVTSDHGEEFWEHGSFLHGHTLFDELLRVPLVIVPPRSSQRAIRAATRTEQVRLADVGVTMLEIAGLSQDFLFELDGISLKRFLEGRIDLRPRPAIAGYLRLSDSRSWAVRTPEAKLIDAADGTPIALYDLAQDPGESRNVAARAAEEVVRLQSIPRRLGLRVGPLDLAAGTSGSSDTKLDSDLLRELRTLGYVD
jgi:arylsulfatase A-like enzyme